jgi:ferredoxin like protein
MVSDILELAEIVPDKISHIKIKNQALCLKKCKNRPCLFICPSLVFRWDEERRRTVVFHERCVECGACAPACPLDNISLGHPRGGFGKVLRD